MQWDVIVIGGSYAGIAAALQVARARRRVLVIDAGERRNRFAAKSYGFLGQDGRSPAAIVADARKQLEAYPNVTWLQGIASDAQKSTNGFLISDTAGSIHHATCVILATGVIDELPAIPGLQERWGKSVFHCPYCHGYELDKGRIGVIATSEMSLHHAMMLPDWGVTTFFTNHVLELSGDQRQALQKRGVAIETSPIIAVSGVDADVHLTDGRTESFSGLFVGSRTKMASPLAEQLGCVLEKGPVGDFIQTDVRKATSVPGVFSCGDAARAFGSVSLAVGDGAMAGASAHQSLIFG